MYRRTAIVSGAVVLAWGLAAESAAQSGPSTAKVQVSKRDCQRFVRHAPSGDVEYEPGVDVRGRPVAPADVDGGNRIEIPDVLTFEITTDLGNLTGKEIGAGRIGDAVVGRLEYDIKSGKMTFNGQELGSAEERQLRELCQQVLRGQ